MRSRAGSLPALLWPGDGPRWVDVLHTIARDWPRELWDDLLPVARTRLAQGDRADEVLWRSRPWLGWAAVDDQIATGVAAFQPRSALARPLEQQSTEDLLTMLHTGGTDRQEVALRELNHRGPQTALLPIVDELPVTELHAPLGRAIRMLGPQALPLARAWAAPPDPSDDLDRLLGAGQARRLLRPPGTARASWRNRSPC